MTEKLPFPRIPCFVWRLHSGDVSISLDRYDQIAALSKHPKNYVPDGLFFGYTDSAVYQDWLDFAPIAEIVTQIDDNIDNVILASN